MALPSWHALGSPIVEADCVEAMRALPASSVDAIVTDPPYGLEFMGMEWDRLDGEDPWRAGAAFARLAGRGAPLPSYGATDTANPSCATCGGRLRGAKLCRCATPDWRLKGETWSIDIATDVRIAQAWRMHAWHTRWAREALRVLKPGGHLLAFGGSRTYHRLAAAVEDAGFEVRDTLCWLYGSGFPKSLDVAAALDRAGQGLAGNWQGWGTALKPAFEPIVLARKPFGSTVAANVVAHGTGALNVHACRVAFADARDEHEAKAKNRHADFVNEVPRQNLVYGRDARPRENYEADSRWPANVILDPDAAALLGGASRFFYCAKTSRRERDAGLDRLPLVEADPFAGHRGRRMPAGSDRFDGEPAARSRNCHPTVKPIELMRWLLRLVGSMPGAIVLDPFAGSGTTVCAGYLEGITVLGVERDPAYVEIARARSAWWAAQPARTPTRDALSRPARRPEQLDLTNVLA